MLKNLRIDNHELLRSTARSPGYRKYARDRAEEIKKVAIQVFNSQQRKDNEQRTSETTPPKYVISWEIKQDGMDLLLVNTDPAAMWVEFGAHAGGRTAVLAYRPLTRAVDIVAARETG